MIEARRGQIVGVVGESGSGKSTAATGIMQFLPPNGRTEPDSKIAFLGEISARPRRAMQHIWGARMSMVPRTPPPR